MDVIKPIWNQSPLKAMWDKMPINPLRQSGAENGGNPTGQTPTAGQIRTAEQTQSTASALIDTWAVDRQANPWTADRAAPSFGEVFQAALERSPEPVADVINPVTDIFGAAVDAVKETDAAKTQMEYLMATGQLDNPALLTIASTKAQLSVQLLVQLRNRALDAYNEIMRISI